MPNALPPCDFRLLSLLAHDLRNPLNAISMSRSLLESELEDDVRPTVREGLEVIGECDQQLRSMLNLVSDYAGLLKGAVASPSGFFPDQVLVEVIEDKRRRRLSGRVPLIVPGPHGQPPARIEKSAGLARIALRLTVENALGAAGDAPVRVATGLADGVWSARFVAEQPPPANLAPFELTSARPPERLIGQAQQRFGLDLALVAWVSEQFNGSARFEVEPGAHSALVLRWPATAVSEGPGRGEPGRS